MNEQSKILDPRNVPFREEWYDESGNIANAIPWLIANCTEATYYNGLFNYRGNLHGSDGEPVLWSFAGDTLMYELVRRLRGGMKTSARVIIRQDKMEIYPHGVMVPDGAKFATVYRPFHSDDAEIHKWLVTARPVVHASDHRHRMAASPHGVVGQIRAIINNTRFVTPTPSLDGRVISSYLFPDTAARTSHTPYDYKAFEPIWQEFQEAINPPYQGMPPEELLPLLLEKVGDALIKINDFFDSGFNWRRSMQSMLAVDIHTFEAKGQTREAFILKSMFGLPTPSGAME